MKIFGGIFDVDKKISKVEELRTKSSEPSFWNDQVAAQKILQEIKSLEQWINLYKSVNKNLNDDNAIYEFQKPYPYSFL